MPSKKTGRRQQRECSSSAWLCSSWVFRPTSDPLWVRVLERHWPLARHVEPTGGYSAGSQEFPKQPPQPPSVRQDRKQTMHRSEDLLFLFQSDLRTEPCAAQRLLHIRPHCTSDCGSVVLLLHAFLYPQPFRRDPGSTLQPVASSHLCFTTWTGVAHLPPRFAQAARQGDMGHHPPPPCRRWPSAPAFAPNIIGIYVWAHQDCVPRLRPQSLHRNAWGPTEDCITDIASCSVL